MLGTKQTMTQQQRVPKPLSMHPEVLKGTHWREIRKRNAIDRINAVLSDPQLDEAFALNYHNHEYWPEQLTGKLDKGVYAFAQSDSTRRSRVDKLRDIANELEDYLEDYERDKGKIVGSGLAERIEELERRVEALEAA